MEVHLPLERIFKLELSINKNHLFLDVSFHLQPCAEPHFQCMLNFTRPPYVVHVYELTHIPRTHIIVAMSQTQLSKVHL